MPSKKSTPTTKTKKSAPKKTTKKQDYEMHPEVYYLALLFIAITGFLVMSL